LNAGCILSRSKLFGSIGDPVAVRKIGPVKWFPLCARYCAKTLRVRAAAEQALYAPASSFLAPGLRLWSGAPCSGEVIEYEEFSMGQVRVAICSGCGTEFRYVPDSNWLKMISPGMRNPT